MRRFLLATACLTLAAATAHAAATPEAAAVLEANHRAMGPIPAAGALHLDYAYRAAGMDGTSTRDEDLATGAYADDARIGFLVGGGGYDGRTPWMRDLSGADTSQEGGDRVQLAVNEAYRNANAWWRTDRGGADIRYAGRDSIEGRSLDHLVVTPVGGKSFDAWFDPTSHLLDRIGENRLFFWTRVLYADYRPEGGVMLAHQALVDPGLGPDAQETYRLRTASIAPARPLAAYARPTAAPTGAEISGGQASVTLPFRLLNNHIYIEGKVNGEGPFTFIVDTGGHTLLSPDLAKAAGITTSGASVGSGAGEKTVTSGFAQVRDIAFGPLHMTDQTAIIQPVYDAAIEGIPVEAMVGFELFRRFAVRIDYGARTITFTDPGRFQPGDAGTPIPFKFYDHLPQVEGDIDGLPAIFDIDTGSRSQVDVTTPFSAGHGLYARYPKQAYATTGWGVGGATHDYMVRLPSLSLGGVRVSDVPAGLSDSKRGSISDANFGGNVGSGLLRRFVVTFDYAHQTMWLKPISPQPQDASAYDRSGMWINASRDGFTVNSVVDKGPAAQAGLKPGDLITALNGRPAKMDELSDARTLLRDLPAGTRVAVDVRRGGETLKLQIVLRDLI
jgi:predicted aspartyl protease